MVLSSVNSAEMSSFINSLKKTHITSSETVGERLLIERKRLGLTQGDVAARTNLSRATVSLYESGTNSADARFLVEMSAAGMDIFFVLTGRRLSEEAVNHFDWQMLAALMKTLQDYAQRSSRRLDADVTARLLRVLYAQAVREQVVDKGAVTAAIKLMEGSES